MSEEIGLEIENDKENIQIFYFFTPNGRQKTEFRFYNMVSNPNSGWYKMTMNDLKAENVRIVVANKISGKVYFDKTYLPQLKPTTKK